MGLHKGRRLEHFILQKTDETRVFQVILTHRWKAEFSLQEQDLIVFSHQAVNAFKLSGCVEENSQLEVFGNKFLYLVVLHSSLTPERFLDFLKDKAKTVYAK